MESIIRNTKELKAAIIALEKQHSEEWASLKNEIHGTIENFKPVNLIKGFFKSSDTINGVKENIMDASIGLVFGFLAKKIFIGFSHNRFKRILGGLMELGLAAFIKKNPEVIKSIANSIFKKLFTHSNGHDKKEEVSPESS